MFYLDYLLFLFVFVSINLLCTFINILCVGAFDFEHKLALSLKCSSQLVDGNKIVAYGLTRLMMLLRIEVVAVLGKVKVNQARMM